LGDKKEIKLRLRGFLDPIVSLLSYLGVSPLQVTISGVVLSAVGAVFVAFGMFLTGGLILLLSGLCDVLDGSLARKVGRVSTFGAFIDSTGDRITELLYFGAIVLYYSSGDHDSLLRVILSLVALGGSYLTSYTRARSEGLGIACSIGLLERPERIAILIAGLLFGSKALLIALIVLACLSVFTAIQRIEHVRKSAGKDVSGGDGGL